MKGKIPRVAVLGLCGMSVFLSVDHFHAPGETLRADALRSEPGGKGFNQAVAARRLGAGVSFLTFTGDDGAAAECLGFLRREGINVFAGVTREEPTAYACILTDSAGDNRVTVYRGAAERLSAGFVAENAAEIENSDVLLLNHEYPAEATLRALEIAEASGVKAVLNPAPAGRAAPELLRRFYLITPNRQEAGALLGLPGETDAGALLRGFARMGLSRAVITLGGDGAAVLDDGRMLMFPALRCSAADTTGAGDCMSAALAVKLADGAALADAVEYAMNAAAISVTGCGVMTALPTAERVSALFRRISPAAPENSWE